LSTHLSRKEKKNKNTTPPSQKKKKENSLPFHASSFTCLRRRKIQGPKSLQKKGGQGALYFFFF
jgi:hypothetical protein